MEVKILTMYNIHMLPAGFGDSILIEYGELEPSYILIDGGPYHEYSEVIKGIRRVAPGLKEIELLVVTHVDIDHIDGIVVMLNQSRPPFKIKQVWFNGVNELEKADDMLGALQGEYLSVLIERARIPHNKAFRNGVCMVADHAKPPVVTLKGGMELRLLNPGAQALKKLLPVWEKEIGGIATPEDIAERLENDHRYDEADDLMGDLSIEQLQDMQISGDDSQANGSSIAFIGTFGNKSCLFAGDAYTACLLPAIESMLEETGDERLRLDAWKLAHHGSKKSTLDALMERIDCKNMFISSDGKRYRHPDKACLAKLLKHNGPGITFHFNFRSEFTDFWDDRDMKTEYGYETAFPEAGSAGITIKL